MKTLSCSLALVLLAFGYIRADNSNQFVASISQHYTDDTNTAINDQINLELKASYIYNGYATYFQRADVNLPGMYSFFSKQSMEERKHGNLLMDYVNKRGGLVQLEQIDMDAACTAVAANVSQVHKNDDHKFCICEFLSSNDLPTCTKPDRKKWSNGLMAMEDALAMEHYVNNKLLELHAAVSSDAHLSHFLEHEMLDEQVDSIYELGGYVTRLKSFGTNNYKLGEYLFDEKFSK